jgi:hypothetical protein
MYLVFAQPNFPSEYLCIPALIGAAAAASDAGVGQGTGKLVACSNEL